MLATENPYMYLEDWLNKSRNLELETLRLLEAQKSLRAICPELAEKLARHETHSRSHIEKIAACLEILQADPAYPSETKAGMSGDAHFGRPWCQDFLNEPHLDASIRLYVIEHCAISQYKIIVEVARQLGQEQIANICEEILCHEEEMAFWLEHLMPEVARNFLEIGSAHVAAR